MGEQNVSTAPHLRFLAYLVLWAENIVAESHCFQNPEDGIVLRRVIQLYIILGFTHAFQIFCAVSILICCFPVISFFAYYLKGKKYDSKVFGDCSF